MKRSTMRRIRIGSEAGFSLVELAATLVVMGILAGVSYGALSSHMPNSRLIASAQRLVGDMRGARQRAITEGNNYVIIVYPHLKRYRIWDDQGSDGHGVTTETVSIVPFPFGVSVKSVSFGGSNSVTFRPDGSTLAGGDVELESSRGVEARIQVIRATGVVKLELSD